MRHVLQAFCLLSAACGLCLIASHSAQAADSQASAKPVDPGTLFDRLDTQHKGVLSADQISTENQGLFKRLLRLAGKPADGQLTRDEFIAQLKSIDDPPPAVDSTAGSSNSNAKSAGAQPKRAVREFDPAKLFDRWDTKHTGKVSMSDVPEKGQRLFKFILRLAGKPADGSLNKEEFIAAAKELMARRSQGLAAKPAANSSAPNGAPQNNPSASKSNGNQGPSLANFDVDTIVERVMKRSTRPDGKLTKSDLPPRMQTRFDKIDTNHDGLVSETELRSWLNKVKRRLAAQGSQQQASSSASNNGNSTTKSGTNTTTTGSVSNSADGDSK